MPHPAPQEPSWTPIPGSTPLTYTRPLLGAEIIHDVAARLNDGLGDVCMGVTFRSTIPTDALELRARESIGRMRFHIPILASTIAADPSDPFSSAWMYTPSTGTADLRAWIDATLTVRHGAFRAEAFILEMNRRRAPSGAAAAQPSHFYLLLDDGADGGGGGVHALFMHGPHTLMDARPTLRCLDALLGWIAQPPRAQPLDALAWGAEWRSLPAAPLAATGGARADWDAAGVPLMQEIGGLLMHPVPTHSLHPPRADVQTPGAMLRVHERLDAAASARVVRAAKAHGFTPSHLFDAAVVLATFSTEPVSPAHAAAAHFTLDPTVISQDRYLVPPHTGLSHFIAGLAMVPVRVPYAATRPGPAAASAKERLLAVMATIKHTLGRFLANPNLPHVLPAQLALHPPRMSKDFSNPHATLTSNLGSVGMLVKSKWAADARETDVPVISVLDMEFGHRLGWQKIISHCWTMNSEIRLQIQAADVWDRDVLQSYLGEIKKQMLVILDDDDEALDPLKSPGATEVRVANSAD